MERLNVGKFTINTPEEGDVKVEINEYYYEATYLSIEELKLVHAFIEKIIKNDIQRVLPR